MYYIQLIYIFFGLLAVRQRRARRGEGGEYQENSYETKKATRLVKWGNGEARKHRENKENGRLVREGTGPKLGEFYGVA